MLLHFFGFGDALRSFELEQQTGLCIRGFRPLQLDGLLYWTQRVARQQHWDHDALQHQVMRLWMERSDQIGRWQAGLESALGANVEGVSSPCLCSVVR